jgi:signal transduction histidine kinase
MSVREHVSVLAVGAFFAAGVTAAFGVDALTSHREHIAAAERETRGAAALLAEQMRQLLSAADQTLKSTMLVRSEWLHDRNRSPAAAHRMLKALEGSDFVSSVAWTDASGRIAAASIAEQPRDIFVTDRDYFQFHVHRLGGGLYVNAPVRSKATGDWVSAVSRRIESPDDDFHGIALAVVNLSYLTRVLEQYHASSNAQISVFLRDGRYLTRFPDPYSRIGTTRAGANLFANHLPHAPVGTFHAPSTSSGEPRIYSYHSVRDYQLVVSVSIPRRAALAAWHDRIRITGSVSGLALIGSLLASWFIGRQARRLRGQERIAQEARLAAEHANRSKSEFLAHMSHELRTPMNAVIGFTEMMTREIFGPVGSPKYREYLGDIAVSGQHLLHVVNNILDLAKVEAGKWEMEEEILDLRGLCETTVQMVRERARASAVAVSIDPAAPAVSICADLRLMRQIVINLLTNGIKFTERGGKVALSWVRLYDGALALRVADTGVGMTEEDCRRVLEPFGRGSAELARARHDTGLGLSICRQFAEMHGGRLEIASRPGHGTTMNVVLPRERVIEPSAAVAAA